MLTVKNTINGGRVYITLVHEGHAEWRSFGSISYLIVENDTGIQSDKYYRGRSKLILIRIFCDSLIRKKNL